MQSDACTSLNKKDNCDNSMAQQKRTGVARIHETDAGIQSANAARLADILRVIRCQGIISWSLWWCISLTLGASLIGVVLRCVVYQVQWNTYRASLECLEALLDTDQSSPVFTTILVSICTLELSVNLFAHPWNTFLASVRTFASVMNFDAQ